MSESDKKENIYRLDFRLLCVNAGARYLAAPPEMQQPERQPGRSSAFGPFKEAPLVNPGAGSCEAS